MAAPDEVRPRSPSSRPTSTGSTRSWSRRGPAPASSRPTAWPAGVPTASVRPRRGAHRAVRARRAGLPRRAPAHRPRDASTRGWSSAGSTSTTREARRRRRPPSARSATSAGSASATTTTSRWSSTGARRPRRRSTGRRRRADGRRAPPGAALQGRRRRRHRGRPAGRRGPDGPRGRRRRRADGGADPHPRRPHARHRRHHPGQQDEAIRAPARGVTEITGGPGTGKTVVALHRAAYLLYSDRRRFEAGGILVVGPSGAYMAYIERVLPSLGEETVTLRSLGDVVDGVTTEPASTRPPPRRSRARLRIRRVLGARRPRRRAGRPGREFRAFVAGPPIRLDRRRARPGARAGPAAAPAQPRRTTPPSSALAEAAWAGTPGRASAPEFLDRFEDHLDVEAFMEQWWPQLDPREVLLWLADERPAGPLRHRACSTRRGGRVRCSRRCGCALETGIWSVADVALVDDLAARLGPGPGRAARGAGLLRDRGARRPRPPRRLRGAAERYAAPRATRAATTLTPHERAERLLQRAARKPGGVRPRARRRGAGPLADAVADARPPRPVSVLDRRRATPRRLLAGRRRGRRAREEAFGTQQRRLFHMDTNYRNAREIFDYAAAVIRARGARRRHPPGGARDRGRAGRR